jgi:ABC-type dipeptide/oligopeptide/nickel transport system permease subunit
MNSSTGKKPLAAGQVILWRIAGATYGAGLGAWLQGVDRLFLGALVGLIVGSLCETIDTLLNRAMTWAISHMPNRVMAGIAGAVIATGSTVGMTLLILGAVGWVGSCWG